MFVLKSTLDTVKRKAKLLAEENEKLKAGHAKLAGELRTLTLSLPARDALGRFTKH